MGQDTTVLLTGATGFLGSHLLESLVNKGYMVVVLKRSFSDTWRINHILDKARVYDIDLVPLEKPFKENKIDVVIHTATNYGKKNERPIKIIDSNLIFPIKLLDIAVRFNAVTFFNTDTFFDTSYNYLKTYTLSKKQLTDWLKIYCEEIQVINLRVQHMIGPKDDALKFSIWLIAQLFENKSELKFTKGEQKRDFIYIDDIVNAYLLLLENRKILSDYSDFDVGTGISTSIRDFVIKTADVVAKISEKDVKPFLNFGALPYKKGECMDVKGNIDSLMELGWKPGVFLDDAILRTVLWYKKERLG